MGTDRDVFAEGWHTSHVVSGSEIGGKTGTCQFPLVTALPLLADDV